MTVDPAPFRSRDDGAVPALLNQALAHHTAGRLDEAAAWYDRILRHDPAHPAALANRALICHQRRDLVRADACYQAALAVQPTAALLSNLGLLRREQGNLAEAEKLLTEALTLSPGFANALYNLGVTLIEADRPAEAIAPLMQRAADPDAPPEVHANLARALAATGDTRLALCHGRQALLLKDHDARVSFRTRLYQKPPAELVPPFNPARPERNVIAFSLFGSRATYVEGAIANIRLVRALYPGWTGRVYLDSSVPAAAVERLREAGARIVGMPHTGTHYGLFWRFLAADDPDVDYFLCRDADARISAREVAAVMQWVASGWPFHVMRDAPFHTELMLAGMWGGAGRRLRGMQSWIDRYYRPSAHRWVDQDFLRLEVWPRICEQTLVHDSHYRLFGARDFPASGGLIAPDHVGAGFTLPEPAASAPEA